jgi:hypothetical protein
VALSKLRGATSTPSFSRTIVLGAIQPLLDTQIEHWHDPSRDIFGMQTHMTSTTHSARVIQTPGSQLGRASGERTGDAAAVIWLLNHPYPIAIGQTFGLPNGDELKAIRCEHRTEGGNTISKVFLS